MGVQGPSEFGFGSYSATCCCCGFREIEIREKHENHECVLWTKIWQAAATIIATATTRVTHEDRQLLAVIVFCRNGPTTWIVVVLSIENWACCCRLFYGQVRGLVRQVFKCHRGMAMSAAAAASSACNLAASRAHYRRNSKKGSC